MKRQVVRPLLKQLGNEDCGGFSNTNANQRLAKRIFLEKLDECLYFPKYFQVETINACNARCIICTVEQWANRESTMMSSGLFDKFVKEIRGYSDWVESVCLNGDGEPTLDKQISQRVSALKKAGIKNVTLSTNGQLLSESLARELIEGGLDEIMVSIDSLNKDTFEQLRRGLKFEVVLDNTIKLIRLRNATRSRMTIRVRMVILEENLHEVPDFLDYWGQFLGVADRAYAMPDHGWGNRAINREDEEKVEYYADKPCVSPFSTMVIHADGKVCLCCVDYNREYLMGDFTKQSIREIWTGKEFSRIRNLHANQRRNEIPLCRGCAVWDREYKKGKVQSTELKGTEHAF